MSRSLSVILALAVWGLRLAAVGALALWFIPEFHYEATETTEETYLALGWPQRWLVSEVTVEASGTMWWDGSVTRKLRKRGPLYAWGPVPTTRGLGDGIIYRRWEQKNPLYGPLWQTGVGVACWFVAVYLNQFRKQHPPAAAPSRTSQVDLDSLHLS